MSPHASCNRSARHDRDPSVGTGRGRWLPTLDHHPTGVTNMRIPTRFAPILFGALLSMIMVAIVSAFVIATSQGVQPGFIAQWSKSCMTTWPLAFVTVTVVAPLVRKVVARMTG
jgi:hypothetical protein